MIWLGIVICLVVSFIFSGIEAGILSVNRVRLKHRARQKDSSALKLERLLGQPERVLTTVLVVTNLANILAITLTTHVLIAWFGNQGYLITGIVFLPVYLLGVELLPKSLFRRFPYRALSMLAEPLRVASLILTPVHIVGEAVTRLLRRGADAPQKLFVAREDFKYLTIETERAGSLTAIERRMIHSVVDFRSVTAKDLMVPASEVDALPASMDIGKLSARARSRGHDRWPVISESGVYTGIVALHDVALNGRRAGPVSALQRRIVKLAPNEPAFAVLHKLRAARSTMGAVIEEGVPVGIVTWEDVMMRLVKSAAARPEPKAQPAETDRKQS